MRTRHTFLVLGVVFGMMLALGQVASAAPSTTLDIVFDGYCDGMHINVPSLGLGSAGTVDGDHTGCVTGGFEGTTSSSPKSFHISTTYGGLVLPLEHWQVNANHTWSVYGISGDLETFINSGTWSPGTPHADRGTAAGLALSRSSARPTVALDIVFDGYCDGMHLNLPSAGLGTPGTVDGDHTGCISGGFVGTSSGRPKGAHISSDYGGSHPELLHFLINANGTWTIYSINGDLQTFVNSGTWSPGTPKGDGRPAAG